MAKWKVEFEIDDGEVIEETVDCHWAYNAPKVAVKQRQVDSELCARAKKIVVTPAE